MTEQHELLTEIFDLEVAQHRAEAEAAALEAKASELRAGWVDRRWGLMEEAAIRLQDQWNAGVISTEEALAVSNEIVKREYGETYMCDATATATLIEAMRPGEPVVGMTIENPTGIMAASPNLEFTAHKKRSDIANPTVLNKVIRLSVRRINETTELIDQEPTTVVPSIQHLTKYYCVGQSAIQALLDGQKYGTHYESDYCGAHHSSYRVSNTLTLGRLLTAAKVFSGEGIPFDTQSIESQVTVGRQEDAAHLRLRRLRLVGRQIR
jgi:hypothetical protein